MDPEILKIIHCEILVDVFALQQPQLREMATQLRQLVEQDIFYDRLGEAILLHKPEVDKQSLINKLKSTIASVPPNKDVISPNSEPIFSDKEAMMLAAWAALQGMLKGEGGPFGGAILSPKGELLVLGHNQVLYHSDPSRHGEYGIIQAFLEKGGDKAALKGTTLICTGEPCAMCEASVRAYEIGKVIYANTVPQAPAMFIDQPIVDRIHSGKWPIDVIHIPELNQTLTPSEVSVLDSNGTVVIKIDLSEKRGGEDPLEAVIKKQCRDRKNPWAFEGLTIQIGNAVTLNWLATTVMAWAHVKTVQTALDIPRPQLASLDSQLAAPDRLSKILYPIWDAINGKAY